MMVSKRARYMFVVLLHSNVRSMLSHEGSLPHEGRIISTTSPSTSIMTMLGASLLLTLIGEEVMYLLVVVGTGSARLGSALEVVCSSSSS